MRVPDMSDGLKSGLTYTQKAFVRRFMSLEVNNLRISRDRSAALTVDKIPGLVNLVSGMSSYCYEQKLVLIEQVKHFRFSCTSCSNEMSELPL